MSGVVAGLIGAGAMGSAIARRLIDGGPRVLTPLAGRSASARARAADAGMIGAAMSELAAADIVLSIVPPSQALDVAEHFVRDLSPGGSRTVFVDCNALDVRTVESVARVVGECGGGFRRRRDHRPAA